MKLHFQVNAKGQLEATFACRECYEGFAHGVVCMTGELKVRFRHVVEIDRPVRVRARLEQDGEAGFRG